MPFAAFAVDVEIEDDEFEVEGSLTLGAGSDGIDPLTEDTTVGIGTFSLTIPADFWDLDDGTFEFEGTIDGVDLDMEITSVGDNSFDFDGPRRESCSCIFCDHIGLLRLCRFRCWNVSKSECCGV